MDIIYKQNCEQCGNYYEGRGKYFCSNHCSNTGKSRPDVIRRNKSIKNREKVRNKLKGRLLSIETINKISVSNKGKHNSPKTEFKKGNIPWNINKNHRQETKNKISEANNGKLIGKNNPNYKNGLPKCSDCEIELNNYHNERCRKCWDKWCIGENNSNWIDGRSFFPYSTEFNKPLKEQIRQRDNCVCQNCSRTQEEELKEFECKLAIHHVDYNKKNCEKTNLITLCKRCNTEVNCNREYWTRYFDNKIVVMS